MLNWITTSSLGIIETGFVSELSVQAVQSLPVSEIKYTLGSGSLPPGLQLKHDGTITGRVAYNSTGTYSFFVSAFDAANTENSNKGFNLTVSSGNKKYTEAYFRPYLNSTTRKKFREFINNESIFIPSMMYRYHDINFGVQRNIKMVLDFGIEQLNLEEYLYPLYENFYRKRLRLGAVKTALAKNSTGIHIYDVLYVEVIDELVDKNDVSVEPVIFSDVNDELYYPASIDNMRAQLQSTTLQDWTTISTNEDLQPRYMMTQQTTDYRTKTYMRVVPLCYTLPNKGKIIAGKIKNSGFKFNTIDFEIDRLLLRSTLDNNADKYLLFNRTSVGNIISTDRFLQGPEGWVRLDDESDQPLERE